MLNVYVVIESGIYRHRVWPFSTQELAEAFAKATSEAGDGYHAYYVWRMPVDNATISAETFKPVAGQECICCYAVRGIGRTGVTRRYNA